MRPKHVRKEKTKKGKSTKKIILQGKDQSQVPRAFASQGFLTTEDSSDGFVVQVYLSIIEARHLADNGTW
jgi:hypothetical protein